MILIRPMTVYSTVKEFTLSRMGLLTTAFSGQNFYHLELDPIRYIFPMNIV